MFMISWDDETPQRRRIGKREQEELRTLLATKQRNRCMYCGKRMEPSYFEIEHKTPVARGGSDRIVNLQLVCTPCNKRKGAATDGEFRKQYKLTPARQAKGPPAKVIPQKYFEDLSKQRQVKKRRASRRADDDWGFF